VLARALPDRLKKVPMPDSVSLARLVAAALSLVTGLAASAAGAQAAPAAPPGPARSEGEGPPISLPPRPDPVTLDVGVRLGGAVRLGGSPSFPIESRTGSLFGIGVSIAPSPRYAVALAYEHAGLGAEHGQGDLGVVDVDRSLDSLWASVRLTLFRLDRVALAVALGPGLVWQRVDADVIALDPAAFQPTTFRCAEGGGPGLGLRAGLGAEIHLGGGFFFGLDAVIDELRLSGDPLGTCAPGAGSTGVFGVRGGLAYRLDVSGVVR
jgi:hypothetical protein